MSMGFVNFGSLSQLPKHPQEIFGPIESRFGNEFRYKRRRRTMPSSSCGLFSARFRKLGTFDTLEKNVFLELAANNGRNSSLPHPVRCTAEPREHLRVVREAGPLTESYTIEKELDASRTGGPSEWKVIPDLWRTCAERFGDSVALSDPHRDPPVKITYNQLEQSILDFAEGLRVYGICSKETVALIADNSHRWLIADQGIMSVGAIDAVRGSRSSTEELLHIIRHSDSVALVVDSPEIYNRLAEGGLMPNPNLKFVVVLWGDASRLNSAITGDNSTFRVISYDEVLKSGQLKRLAHNFDVRHEVLRSDDLATIVYTSGTSGNPKGVMLTHSNLLHQVKNITVALRPQPGDVVLSLLPPWHMYERSAEYFTLAQGVVQVYSTVKNFKDDLVKYPPDFFLAVPLVFDILYSGVQKRLASGSAFKKALAQGLLSVSLLYMHAKKITQGEDLAESRVQVNWAMALGKWLGACVLALVLLPLHLLAKKLVLSKIRDAITVKQVAISGGGSLSPTVDKFFEAIGICLLNGYGLTETSPVITARRRNFNILGSVGLPLPETEIKVVDPATDAILKPGNRGLIKVRGPQVMKGYYKNPAATNKVIDENGWFDTGDLGWIAPQSRWRGGGEKCAGVLVIDGRAKDTIVLSTGENVEPTLVEEVALLSPLVQQIVVVGQDQRRLGALIVANKSDPSAENLSDEELKESIGRDLRRVAAGSQFSVGPFFLVDEPFTVENGLLTPTMKIKREAVVKKYLAKVDDLFHRHG